MTILSHFGSWSGHVSPVPPFIRRNPGSELNRLWRRSRTGGGDDLSNILKWSRNKGCRSVSAVVRSNNESIDKKTRDETDDVSDGEDCEQVKDETIAVLSSICASGGSAYKKDAVLRTVSHCIVPYAMCSQVRA